MKKPSKKQSNSRFITGLKFIKKRKIALLIVATLLIAISLLINKNSEPNQVAKTAENGNEIELIKGTEDPVEQSKYYLALIKRVGPVEAQEKLLKSGMPFTGETHLINHTVGEYIFDTYGLEGITYCRDYFLGSCYHGLLLNVIEGDAEKDKGNIEKIVKYCTDAPAGALTQCIHGVGHGYVPAVGYGNLFTALEQCDRLGESVKGFLTYNCLDGAFMENIWGVHSGKPSPDRLVKDNDPLYPCNDSRMKPQYVNPCWSNQPSLIYQQYQGDIAKVSQTCLQVEPTDAKETCFNGLSRQIHPLTENKAEKVFELCDLIDTNWREYCYLTNVNAAFSVGDRTMPFDVCAQLSPKAKEDCHNTLISSITYFAASKEEANEWCGRIKDDESKKAICLQASNDR